MEINLVRAPDVAADADVEALSRAILNLKISDSETRECLPPPTRSKSRSRSHTRVHRRSKSRTANYYEPDIQKTLSSLGPRPLPPLPIKKMANPTVPKPGPAKLTRNAGLEEWLEQAKQCKYLPEPVMKQLCEMVKECLMEGELLY